MLDGCWDLAWKPAILRRASRNHDLNNIGGLAMSTNLMSTNLKDQPSTSVNEALALPQRLHHNARVVKDHEQTRLFYQDIVGMPLLATWAEVGQFPEFAERKISFCHTFYGLADGGALAFFWVADPDVYEGFKGKTQIGFN